MISAPSSFLTVYLIDHLQYFPHSFIPEKDCLDVSDEFFQGAPAMLDLVRFIVDNRDTAD